MVEQEGHEVCWLRHLVHSSRFHRASRMRSSVSTSNPGTSVHEAVDKNLWFVPPGYGRLFVMFMSMQETKENLCMGRHALARGDEEREPDGLV